MERDWVQHALAELRKNTPDWYSWKDLSLGHSWENAVSIIDGVTKPTKKEFDDKVIELKQRYVEDQVRNKRDRLLSQSDWVVTRATETSESIPTEWADYRQNLRDIPQQTGFPHDVVWPVDPEESK